jgi:hypothetical protein
VKTRIDCTQAELLIPLYASGDLDAGEQKAVRSHLDSCAGCRELLGKFEASRQWLRSLETPDFPPLVIDLPQKVSWPVSWLDRLAFLLQPRFAIAAACILILLAIGGWLLSRTRQIPNQTVAKEDNAPFEVKTKILEPPKASARPANKRFAPRPKPFVPIPANDLIIEGLEAPAENATIAGNTEPEMMRIEFQTADPNIRIIWFAPKSNEALNNK